MTDIMTDIIPLARRRKQTVKQPLKQAPRHRAGAGRLRGLIATLDAQILVGGLMLVATLTWQITGDLAQAARLRETDTRLERLVAAGRADLLRHYAARLAALPARGVWRPDQALLALRPGDGNPAPLPDLSGFGTRFSFCYARRAGPPPGSGSGSGSGSAITLWVATRLPAAFAGAGTRRSAMPEACRDEDGDDGDGPVLVRRSQVTAAGVEAGRLRRQPGGPDDANVMRLRLEMSRQDIGTPDPAFRPARFTARNLHLARALEVTGALAADQTFIVQGGLSVATGSGPHDSDVRFQKGFSAPSGSFDRVEAIQVTTGRLETDRLAGGRATFDEDLSVDGTLTAEDAIATGRADLAEVTVSARLDVTQHARAGQVGSAALDARDTLHARQAVIRAIEAKSCTGDCP